MLEIQSPSYEDLIDDEKFAVPSNGCGKESANYLKVLHNGEVILLESDAMEPEDCVLHRDLSWIAPALQKMYELGLSDSAAAND